MSFFAYKSRLLQMCVLKWNLVYLIVKKCEFHSTRQQTEDEDAIFSTSKNQFRYYWAVEMTFKLKIEQ